VWETQGAALLLVLHLWCHVVQCAAAAEGQLSSAIDCKTKVTEPEFAMARQKDVLRFNITVQ
jgi:hypothetical protein